MKKSILTSIIAVAMCAGVCLTNGQQPDQSALTIDGVEAVADVEGPEIVIECNTDPESGPAKCWIAKYKDDDPKKEFLGCKFNGSIHSFCYGNSLGFQ